MIGPEAFGPEHVKFSILPRSEREPGVGLEKGVGLILMAPRGDAGASLNVL